MLLRMFRMHMWLRGREPLLRQLLRQLMAIQQLVISFTQHQPHAHAITNGRTLSLP